MRMSTETTMFFDVINLLRTRFQEVHLISYWNEQKQFVYGIHGKEAEVTINYGDYSHFRLEMREEERAPLYDYIDIPFNATPVAMEEALKRTVNYILDPTTPF